VTDPRHPDAGPAWYEPAPGYAAPHANGYAADVERLIANLERVVRGKTDVLRLVVTCLLAEGHVLVEDVPGTGKTTIARALAASVEGVWSRIQFTPDLLPSDVTGSEVVDLKTNDFVFRAGPIFANIVLADEINRASPKTQSALLEVMEEHHVTYNGRTHPVPRPFLVIATQNPIEIGGTYRLPEAQLDRFLMRIDVGYPSRDAEVEILGGVHDGTAVDALSPVLNTIQLQEMIVAASRVHVDEAVKQYIVDLSAATRPSPDRRRQGFAVQLGVSPRGSVALQRAARAAALAAERDHVLPEDVKRLAVPVLAHRIVLTPEAALNERTPVEVMEEVVRTVPVPRVTTA
jgi:MoxR-like ATPase